MSSENTEAIDNYIAMSYNIERYTKLITDSSDIEMFIFLTDCHTHLDGNTFNKKGDGFDLLKSYVYNLPVEFVLNGGDWLNGYHHYKTCIAYLGFLNGFMKQSYKRHYFIVGNHDTAYLYYDDRGVAGTGKLPHQLMKNLFMPEYENTYYEFDGLSTHFYIFDADTSHRTLVLNDITRPQIHWVASSLLNNQHPHVAFGIHMWEGGHGPLEMIDELTLIINAFNTRQSYTFDDITYDFSNTIGRIEFVIAGHQHKDINYVLSSGVPVVVTTHFKSGGHAFDIVYVDYDKRKLYCVRAGRGSDRTFDLDTGQMI